jgi:hypothetical protein
VRKGNTAGQRLACVLVEIGDDEQPLQAQEKPSEDEPAEPLGPLAMWAVQRCKEPMFQKWLAWRFRREIADEKAARLWLLELGDIKSRREIDTNKDVGDWFKDVIMTRYAQWLTTLKAGA